MNDNVNTSPKSEPIEEKHSDEIASRWQRLWASLVDTFIMLVISTPVAYFTGGFDNVMDGAQPSINYTLLMGIFSLFVFILINGKLLVNKGQTIGKRILGIKIVDVDGNLPTVVQHLLKRYAMFFIPVQIPVVGGAISIINILFIFGKKKRCIHDLIANTRVVKC
jgi:uncharacterized RDD family membrane protein YckC